MSKSRNVRSRYQGAPHYVIAGVREKDSSIRIKARDLRAVDKRATRAVIESILQGTLEGTGDES